MPNKTHVIIILILDVSVLSLQWDIGLISPYQNIYTLTYVLTNLGVVCCNDFVDYS